MSLVLLACALLPQLTGAEGDEPRTVLWPVGSGYAQYALYNTYGTPLQRGKILHAGLDVCDHRIGSETRNRSVYALEDGSVERVFVDEAVNYVSGIVVRSKAKPERAWLYLHLEKDSLRFAEGEEVGINQILGDVLLDDTVTGVEHVHLSRLGGDFANQDWEHITELNVRNPLALFVPVALGDGKAPEVVEIPEEDRVDGEEHLVFRADESDSSSARYSRVALPASTASQPYPTDVLACVRDEDGGPHVELAPYRLTLTVKDEPPETFVLCLDGPLPRPEVICEPLGRGRNKKAYFVLTSGGESCGSAPALANAWLAEAGPHTLELTVEDVNQNKTTVTTVVEAQAP